MGSKDKKLYFKSKSNFPQYLLPYSLLSVSLPEAIIFNISLPRLSSSKFAQISISMLLIYKYKALQQEQKYEAKKKIKNSDLFSKYTDSWQFRVVRGILQEVTTPTSLLSK